MGRTVVWGSHPAREEQSSRKCFTPVARCHSRLVAKVGGRHHLVPLEVGKATGWGSHGGDDDEMSENGMGFDRRYDLEESLEQALTQE